MAQNIKPRYEVELLEGTVKETHTKRVEVNGIMQNVDEQVEVPAGWMVYFPGGHSIRVRTPEEMKRLEFDVPAELVDQDTGDVVGTTEQQSLKRHVQRKAGASGSKAHTAPIDANQ